MTYQINLKELEPLQAIVNSQGDATLTYLAESKNDNDSWQLATTDEFRSGHDLDDLLGVDGNALVPDDLIICTNGVIKGSELL